MSTPIIDELLARHAREEAATSPRQMKNLLFAQRGELHRALRRVEQSRANLLESMRVSMVFHREAELRATRAGKHNRRREHRFAHEVIADLITSVPAELVPLDAPPEVQAEG